MVWKPYKAKNIGNLNAQFPSLPSWHITQIALQSKLSYPTYASRTICFAKQTNRLSIGWALNLHKEQKKNEGCEKRGKEFGERRKQRIQ